ncbi:heavy metal translocating P-type ATPase metal-binding domain-containing protein [Arcicella sp. LKC2W]|uniref:heavy metal translocating P-type ATPase n=1 Tax=Arcicella sp. LKC2W TaxID=2984198 RepID=UPI002B209D82|nr:heavy metal translocating P-type ATPase metal-binding domain-containing protein [Arcicella sp. LKC2W]MEA5459019.1 heavy metal translocating P-type ATPase metal-binding domain-containing protein [Arcicella sp. LKC2W]
MTATTTDTSQLCFHCGIECPDDHIHIDEKYFCCNGCKTVYQILEENNLCQYYDLEKMGGNSPQIGQFSFLDNAVIANNLLDFQNDSIAKVTFYIPSIHCSSCLYLLENLYRLHPAIERSQVDFLKKQVSVTFQHKDITFRQVAELLTSLGYEPMMSLSDVVKEKQKPTYRKLLTQLGVAGFCAGNIMLFSFPEYLGLQDATYKNLFGYLNIILAIPVVFYSASGYFESVYKSLRKGIVNIDFPILLSILVAFCRGIYEVVFNNGAGYFDSLTGLVFFLLIGKWFQQKTYNFLSFERDYKSYFPLAVTRLLFGKEEAVSISDLKKGDKILVRNGELIPADSMLYKGNAQIDYSFVTGESALEEKQLGDFLYAGGRQVGGTIEMEVLKEVSQSYLTQLWNNDTFQKEQDSRIKTFSNAVGKYFTFGVLTLAFSVALYWYLQDPSKMLNAFTAVLIIACPCTLSLSYPFALGNGLRLLGKQYFYLKNGEVIEQMANCDTIVFDKTGTLTTAEGSKPQFYGNRKLSSFEEQMIASLVRNSSHPIAQKIKHLVAQNDYLTIENFREIEGKGIEGEIDGLPLKLGSSKFLGLSTELFSQQNAEASVAHVAINNHYLGYFSMPNFYREGIENTIAELNKKYQTFLLSGDNEAERHNLEKYFSRKENLYFNCSPQDKLSFIKKLQNEGNKVIMIGDGLNDAGALKQADVGIAITDDTLNFTPMSDAILRAEQLSNLPKYLNYSDFGLRLIKFSYMFSLMYNCIGLTFAIQGTLSPVVAAILMPVNSITLVGIASLGMIWGGRKLK